MLKENEQFEINRMYLHLFCIIMFFRSKVWLFNGSNVSLIMNNDKKLLQKHKSELLDSTLFLFCA